MQAAGVTKARGGLLLFLRGGSTEPTAAEGGGAIPPHDGGGTVHLRVAIPLGEPAARDTHRRAEAVTVAPHHLATRGGRGTSLYMRDPDDILVELAGW